jgi:sensor histidine kinase YesM
MTSRLRSRYDSFADRVLASLSEIEREDVRAFDRWFYASSGWRWLFVIVGATTAFAWIASVLPWNMSFVEAAILFNLVVLMLIWAGLSAWFGYRRFQGKIFRFVVVGPLLALAGAFVGAGIAGVVKGVDPLDWLHDSAKLRHVVTAGLVFGFLYALVVALIAHLRNREYAALAARLESEARQSELSRQLAESQLKLLQLQVEPHFLFNTLASARQLAERGAPDAAKLVGDLIVFLRAATPSMRESRTSLAAEGELVRAYLSIMRTRLGRRLEFAVAIPQALSDVPLPPGMLITLVENAIKHGIEPWPAGGRVDVVAHATDDRVEIDVADTGAGLDGSAVPGTGIGLANIRERLSLLYGERASLELAQNDPRGFRARLSIPREAPPASVPFVPVMAAE